MAAPHPVPIPPPFPFRLASVAFRDALPARPPLSVPSFATPSDAATPAPRRARP